MKQTILFLALVLTNITYGQKLKFKVEGIKDSTVHLVRYLGKGLYYADTANMKKGVVTFDGSKQKQGILALYLPGKQQLLEVVHSGEDVYIETKLPNLINNAVVKKSEQNKVFYDYVRFMNKEKKKAKILSDKLNKLEKDSEQYKQLQAEIDKLSEKVKKYQEDLAEKHKDKLIGKIIKMSMDIEIPETPKDKDSKVIDETFAFRYFRDHYWDNIDLNDDRLVRTPVFHNKLEYYFTKVLPQHWDTIVKYAYHFCDRLTPGTDTYQYCVSWVTSHYEKSPIMGMDKVFVKMAERYYCATDGGGKPKADWVKEKNLKKLCEKAEKNKRLVMGEIPPNLILPDTSGVWYDFYSLKNDYIILYFWDPECGHCKKVTPKLQKLYAEKLKDRNIEVFAVGKAIGSDFAKWKKFINKHHLSFINVALTDSIYRIAQEDARQLIPKYTTLESLNYHNTYDIFATPKVFVLDKDKKIVAKSLTIPQLEKFLDQVQGVKDAPILFPEGKDKKEDIQMH